MPPKRRDRNPNAEAENEGNQEEQQQEQNLPAPRPNAGRWISRERYSNGRPIFSPVWMFVLWRRRPPNIGGDGTNLGPRFDYIRFQMEHAPHHDPNNVNRGYHWQGYIEFDRPMSAEQIRRTMDWGDCWLAPRFGSQDQALDYVWKDDTAVDDTREEQGTKHQENARDDYKGLLQDAQDGLTIDEIALRRPSTTVRCFNAVQKVVELFQEPPFERQITGFVLYGATGKGKSHAVFHTERNEGRAVYDKIDGQWWCGYNRQPTILFQEFYGEYSLGQMLKWTDKWQLRVNVRGGTRNAWWDRVYFTSNVHPDLWYPKEHPDKRAALMRRLTHIIHFAPDAPTLLPATPTSVATEPAVIEEVEEEARPEK